MGSIAPIENNPFMQMSKEDFYKYLDDWNLTYEETTHEGYIILEDGTKLDAFASDKYFSITPKSEKSKDKATSDVVSMKLRD